MVMSQNLVNVKNNLMKHFVCPHCGIKGISFYAKFRSWRYNPAVCKNCGKSSYKNSLWNFVVHIIGNVISLALLYFWFLEGNNSYLMMVILLILIVTVIKTLFYPMKKKK